MEVLINLTLKCKSFFGVFQGNCVSDLDVVHIPAGTPPLPRAREGGILTQWDSLRFRVHLNTCNEEVVINLKSRQHNFGPEGYVPT